MKIINYTNKMMKKVVLIIGILSMFSCVSNKIKIENYKDQKKALLVIDMQLDYIGKDGKFTIENNQMENLINITNEIIEYFHKNNLAIIYFRNIFKDNDFKNKFRNYAAIEGSLGAEIDPRIIILSENIYDKYSPNAFTNGNFENFLINNQINELYLCGVMADECVYETAMGAFNKGYTVNYYGNAVGSSSIKKIERVIKKLEKIGINILYY